MDYIPLGAYSVRLFWVDAADRAAVGQRPGGFCSGADQLNARCRGQGGHQIPRVISPYSGSVAPPANASTDAPSGSPVAGSFVTISA